MKRLAIALLAAIAACSPSSTEPIESVAEPLTVIPDNGGSFNGSTAANASGVTNQYGGTCGGSSAREQVYQWRAPRSGSATFKTCNGGGSITNYDTVLYVRRNTITGTELACNDDAPSCNPDASKITANVVACTTYFIFVDGWGTTSGNFTLTVTPPSGSGSTCADAGQDAAADVSQDGASDGAGDVVAEETGTEASDVWTGDSTDESDGGDAVVDSGGDDGFDGAGEVADSAPAGDGGPDGVGPTEGGPDDGGGEGGATGPYPLRKQAGARYLVDQAGNPFLIHGDTAWSMMAQLTTEDAIVYLDDRASRGVNSVVVNLVEHYYAAHAPADIYGVQPFTTTGDFSTPNPAYFNRVDAVIQAAGARGIQVFLLPAYLGWQCDTSEGWYAEMVSSGTTKMFGYGAYLGTRYRDVNNIVWVMGGDCDPPNKALVENIANGIRSIDTRHLMTTHGEENNSTSYWSGEPWLDFDSVYSNTIYAGHQIRDIVSAEYQHTTLPIFLIETQYEFSTPSTAAELRGYAYEAILNGGMGQFFGAGKTWCFDSGCLGTGWRTALSSQGSRDQAWLKALFSARQWWKLVPQTFLTAGGSSASVAKASDGTWGAAYFPTSRSVTVNLASFSRTVSGSWFNPSTGAFTQIAGSPFANSGSVTTSPPSSGDWAVVFE